MHKTNFLKKIQSQIGILPNLKKNFIQKCLKIILELIKIIRKNMKPHWIK